MNAAAGNFSFSRKADFADYFWSVKDDPSQRIKDLKFRVFRFLLKPYADKASVLDLGCGDAFYLDYLLEDGIGRYTGVDISQLMINRINKNHERKKDINLIVGDMTDKKLALNDIYDLVISIYSLMKIKKIGNIFKLVDKKMKKNGIFFIMTNTFLEMNLELKDYMVEIRKNDKVFFNNYPRSKEKFCRSAQKYGFRMLCSFDKPFSKDKVITYPNPKKISGFDTILMFEKE